MTRMQQILLVLFASTVLAATRLVWGVPMWFTLSATVLVGVATELIGVRKAK